VLWLREGLEATLRAAELFTDHFEESIIDKEMSSATKKNLLAEVICAREAFRGTLYRLVSLHGRLDNINTTVSLLMSELFGRVNK
jgi:hypothetical protein